MLARNPDSWRKLLGETGEFSTDIREGPVLYPKLGKFIALIEQILKDDETAPVKQRHTAMQLYRRLVGPEFAEPYAGEYNAVRRYVQRHRQMKAERKS